MSLLWRVAAGNRPSVLHILDHLDPEGAYAHLAAQHGLAATSSVSHEQSGEVSDLVHQAHLRDGFTVHAQRGDAPDHGYIVSESKHSERRIPLEHLTTDHIRQYAHQNKVLLKHPQRWLGCWVDHGEDGSKTAVLDVNRCYESHHDAERHSLATDQDAFYDVANKKEIRVKKPQPRLSSKWGHLMGSNKALIANGLPPSPHLPWAPDGDF